jgi:phosphoribosylformylglycinamidine synthase
VACGGFSYGDTLGAGEGWARSVLFNEALTRAVPRVLPPRRHLRAGHLQRLPDVRRAGRHIPGADAWPRFTRNRSEQFEARLSMVEVLDSPSIFRRHGRHPAADRGRARRGLRRLLAARATRDAVLRAMRFVDALVGRGDGIPGQPQRSARTG